MNDNRRRREDNWMDLCVGLLAAFAAAAVPFGLVWNLIVNFGPFTLIVSSVGLCFVGALYVNLYKNFRSRN